MLKLKYVFNSDYFSNFVLDVGEGKEKKKSSSLFKLWRVLMSHQSYQSSDRKSVPWVLERL